MKFFLLLFCAGTLLGACHRSDEQNLQRQEEVRTPKAGTTEAEAMGTEDAQ